MRDLHADLRICDAATEGPWEATDVGNVNITKGYRYRDGKHVANWIAEMCDEEDDGQVWLDAQFIAEARTGWPEAIRRAIDAERRVKALRELCAAYKRENERLHAELIARDVADGINFYYDSKPCRTCGVYVAYTCPIGQDGPVPCESIPQDI